jgi:hypothetical protein
MGWHHRVGRMETGPDAVAGRQGAFCLNCAPMKAMCSCRCAQGACLHGQAAGASAAAAGRADPARHAASEGRHHLAPQPQFFFFPFRRQVASMQTRGQAVGNSGLSRSPGCYTVTQELTLFYLQCSIPELC